MKFEIRMEILLQQQATAQQTTYIPPVVESDVPLSQNSDDNFIDKVSDNFRKSIIFS